MDGLISGLMVAGIMIIFFGVILIFIYRFILKKDWPQTGPFGMHARNILKTIVAMLLLLLGIGTVFAVAGWLIALWRMASLNEWWFTWQNIGYSIACTLTLAFAYVCIWAYEYLVKNNTKVLRAFIVAMTAMYSAMVSLMIVYKALPNITRITDAFILTKENFDVPWMIGWLLKPASEVFPMLFVLGGTVFALIILFWGLTVPIREYKAAYGEWPVEAME